MKIGYLCSEFPALSHTFISREIDVLEKEGFTIASASINSPRNTALMGAWDQNRAQATYVLKATSALTVLASVLAVAIRLPTFLRVLWGSFTLTWFNGPRNLGKTIGYFVQALLLRRWAKQEGLRHVHVHFANPAASVAWIASLFPDFEYSLSVHGPDEFYETERWSLREKVQRAVFVRCISHFCKSQLMRLTPIQQWDKFVLVRCGLYPDEFAPRPARLGPKSRILCVGRICPSKGQAILLEVARELQRRGLSFHFLFLGGGEDLETLRALAEQWELSSVVTIAGPVGHSRVKAELADCDLFVLPSFAEGIPIALMEAMAAGIPVVGTNITGIPELIESGVDGFLTQASHVEQMVDLLSRLITGTIDTSEMVKRAAVKVRMTYDVVANTRILGTQFRTMRS